MTVKKMLNHFKHKKLSKKGKIISVVSLVLFLSALVYVIKKDKVQEILGAETSRADIFLHEDGTRAKTVEEWQKINPEVICVLRFLDDEGFRSIPILATRQPEFYFKHNVFGNYDSMGATFIDLMVTDINSDNHIIFGHSSKTEDWNFSFLKKYENEEFFDKYQSFWIDLPGGEEQIYNILMLERYDIEEDDYFEWASDYFNSSENAIEMFQESSKHAIQIRNGLTYQGQEIITLVTCDMNGKDNRYVLHAIRSS